MCVLGARGREGEGGGRMGVCACFQMSITADSDSGESSGTINHTDGVTGLRPLVCV